MSDAPHRADDVIAVEVIAAGWRTALANSASAVEIAAAAARATLARINPPGAVEFGVRLSDDEDIRALNRDYRGRDSATNVLSFALGDETGCNNQLSQQPQGVPKLLGDVVTAFETCAKEAEVQNKMLADHLRHMVVHGVLHLLGYDHQSDDDAQIMENLEREILAGLGVADPYARDAA